jgi:hypothetical protein
MALVKRHPPLLHYLDSAMQLGTHSNKDNARRSAAAALALLTSMVSAGQIACAQSMDNAGFAPLSNEQSSLLPPEVVPVDPAAANSMSAAQAAKRQMQTQPGNDVGSVPGLVNNNKPGTISARDFQNQGAMQQQQPWQSAAPGFMGQNQNPGMNSPYGSPYGQAPTYAGEVDMASANAQPAQSQTMTGGSNNQATIQNTSRAGLTNTLSGGTTFGLGAFSTIYGASPLNLLTGAGIWALMLNGFGNRNGFRL